MLVLSFSLTFGIYVTKIEIKVFQLIKQIKISTWQRSLQSHQWDFWEN